MYACVCKGITESQVQDIVAEGPVSAESLVQRLGLDESQCCGRCRRIVCAYFCSANAEGATPGCRGSRLGLALDAAAASPQRRGALPRNAGVR